MITDIHLYRLDRRERTKLLQSRLEEPEVYDVQENKERWKELCEQAAGEQDPVKLLELTEEINRLLAKKQDRLDHLPNK
jgi:hypothetical protein